MSMFTSFCPLCGGVQCVKSRDDPSAAGSDLPSAAPDRDPTAKRPWWRFWG